MRRNLGASVAVAGAMTLSLGLSAQAASLPYELEYLSKPFIAGVVSESRVEVSQNVLLSGGGLNQVKTVYVDQKKASFEVLSDSQVQVEIPYGVNPGDAVLRISGDFGLESYQNLFEVLPTEIIEVPKITIGSFQGFAAVYTKNFKGKVLTITIGDRQRVIQSLPADFTQNLTKIGSGRIVEVKVFIDHQLVETKLLTIK